MPSADEKCRLFLHGGGAKIKKEKKGREKKEKVCGPNGAIWPGFGRGTPPASPDSDAPTRSDPRNALGAGRPPPKATFCFARLFGY